MENVSKECSAKVTISEEHLKALQKHQIPEGENVGCFINCFLETLNMFKDGKAERQALVDGAKQVFGDSADVTAKLGELTDKCIEEASGETDKCEYAGKFSKCIHKTFKEAGLDWSAE